MNDFLPAQSHPEQAPPPRRRFNLRLLLILAITGLVLAGMLGITALHAIQFDQHAREEAKRALELSSQAVQAKSEELLAPALEISRYVAAMPLEELAGQPGTRDHRRFLDELGIVPSFNAQIYSAYLGFPDGSFVAIFKNVPALREAVGLEEAADSTLLRYVRDASQSPALDRWSWIEAGAWRTVERPPLDFDPRVRPWYRLALEREGPAWTELYRAVVHIGYAITHAVALRDESGEVAAVLGVDVRLDDLVTFIRDLEVSPRAFAFLAEPGGALVAHPTMSPDLLTSSAALESPTLFHVNLPNRADLRIFEALSESERPRVEMEIDGETVVGQRLPLDPALRFGADLYVGAPLSDFTAAADRVALVSLALAAVLTLLVIAVGILIARAVSRPIQKAVQAMDAIARLEETDDAAPEPSLLTEIDSLNASVGMMKAAVRSFGHYVPKALVRDLLALRQPLRLGGQRREITVLFTDIRDFTAITETEQHERVVEMLADYFEIVSSTITAHGGTVDKFIGDSVMAFWGAPHDDPEHSRHALEAVAECRQRLAAFNQELRENGLPVFETRFGLHRGYAFVGNVGARDRFSYTALGDIVNTASRLESYNRKLGTEVLASREVVSTAGRDMIFESRGLAKLNGKAKEIEVFELVQEKAAKIAAIA